MAFDIKFLADVSPFIKGTDDIAEALKAVGDDLKDVAKDSDKALDNVEKDLQGVTKESKDMSSKIGDAFSKMGEESEKFGKNTGDSVKRGTDKAKEGFNDLKEESSSTAKEAAASFGSIEDAADALQEVAANALVGFGPAGMAAGIMAAAGIGLAISALQDNADKINENKEKVIDMAQTIAENGGTLRKADYISAMEDYGYSIVDTKEWLDIFQEDAVTGFEKMADLSKKSGIDLKTAFDGAFGSVEDSEKALAKVNEKLTILKDKKEEVYNLTGSVLDPVDGSALTSLDELRKKMEENIKNQRIAEEMEKARRAAIEGTTEATLEDIAALEKRTGIIQEGATSELDYLDQVAQTSQILADNKNALDINTQAGRDNQRALIDQSTAAIDMAQGQLEAGKSADVVAGNLAAQREALLLQIDAMTGSRAKSEELAAALGLIPKEVIAEVKTNGVAESKTDIETIPATTDTTVNVSQTGAEDTQSRINAVTGKEVIIDVDDNYTATAVQGRINNIKGREGNSGPFIDVDDNYTTSAVQGRIDAIKGRDVYVNLKIGNEFEFQQNISRLTQSVSKVVNIETRGGVPND